MTENTAANDNPAGFIESLQGFASMCESYSRPGGAPLDPQDLQMFADKFRDCAFAVSFAAQHREKLDAEIGRLRAALKPFAEPHAMGDNYVRFAPRLIEAARAALNPQT